MKLQMRSVTQFQLPSNVLLHCRGQNGNQPAFMLNKRANRQIGTGSPFEAHARVGLGATARKKLVACLELPEAERKLIGGRKVIRAPTLVIPGIATDRIAEQETFIGIGVVVLVIKINESRTEVMRSQHLGG